MSMETFDEIKILNTRFHKITAKELINFITKTAKLNKKTIIGNVNVQAVNLAYKLPWYRDFLNHADLVFCDGFGIILGARLLGYPVNHFHRMTAPDYLEDLIVTCEKQDISIFFLAGRPGVTEKAIIKLKSIAPQLKVAGHHGYFKKFGEENDKIIKKINEFRPNILYVGFGMPLQEQWILENINQIEANVFLPLGACLDFYAGLTYRGPRFVTDKGFEWLTRLITQPKYLWKRYIFGNPVFIYRVFKELIFKK